MRYNLLDEKWIPVLYGDGGWERVGIRQALQDAGRIRQIAASNPMDNVSLFRLLMAVLQWCEPSPTKGKLEQLRSKQTQGVPSGWLEERLGPAGEPNATFDLLGGENAFLQLLPPSTKPKPGSKGLLHEVPSATNIAHFRHVRDKQCPLCLACLAMGLVRLPAFTTSRGSGNFPGINQVPPIYYLPRRATLLGALLANWPMQSLPDDRPAWDACRSKAGDRNRVGVLQGLTWLPRRVRVSADPEEQACVLCGRVGPCCSSIGMEKPTKQDAKRVQDLVLRKRWTDPHVGYEREPAKSKQSEAVHPGSLRATDSLESPWDAAAEWRTLWQSLLVESAPGRYIGPPLWLRGNAEQAEVECVGFVTDGRAKYFEARATSVALPPDVMAEPARTQALRDALAWVADLTKETLDAHTTPRKTAWNKPVAELRDATFLKAMAPRPGRRMHALRASLCQVRQLAEDELQGLFLAFAGTPRKQWAKQANAWRPGSRAAVRRALQAAVGAATPGSALKRLEATRRADAVARAASRPITRPPPAHRPGRTRKKGGK